MTRRDRDVDAQILSSHSCLPYSLRRLFPEDGRIAKIYREEAGPYSLYDMTERLDARFGESTIGGISHGEFIAVHIDRPAHCVGLYVTNYGQAIWYDSDENFDYECASCSIDIDDDTWELFRVTTSSNMDQADIQHLFTQMSGKGSRITSVNKIPPKSHGMKIRSMREGGSSSPKGVTMRPTLTSIATVAEKTPPSQRASMRKYPNPNPHNARGRLWTAGPTSLKRLGNVSKKQNYPTHGNRRVVTLAIYAPCAHSIRWADCRSI